MTTMTNPNRTPAVPRRRRRGVRRLVIALVVLAALLVVADFAAAAIFEHEVSKRARAEFNLADDPDVQVHGFSFLLQAISGEYDWVEVKAKGVPVKDLHDVEITADLRGVHAPLSELLSGAAKQVTMREVKGTVTIQASDVTRAIAANESDVVKSITRVTIDPVSEAQVADANAKPPAPDAKPEPAGKTAGARICATADIAGSSTDVCVFGLISLGDQQISFVPKRLEVRNGLTTGKLAGPVQDVLLKMLTLHLPTGALPFKITPTAVEVKVGQLLVSGEAKGVTFGAGSTG